MQNTSQEGGNRKKGEEAGIKSSVLSCKGSVLEVASIMSVMTVVGHGRQGTIPGFWLLIPVPTGVVTLPSWRNLGLREQEPLVTHTPTCLIRSGLLASLWLRTGDGTCPYQEAKARRFQK